MDRLRRWLSSARRQLFGNYAELRDWWRLAAAPQGQPDAVTTELVQTALEAQLERASQAVKNVEDKAALVIPAIGVIVGIVGADVSSRVEDSGLLFGLGLAVVIAAVVSIGLAVLAIAPRSHSNGPPADRVVRGITETPAEARVNYVKSLGFAVYSEEERVIAKAWFLNWSLRAFGVGVILLLVFAGRGGLK